MKTTLLSVLHVAIVVLFGAIFIPTYLKEPLPEESFGKIFILVFSFIALGIGGFGAIAPEKFVKKNERQFYSLYEETKIPVFKLQAEGMGKPYMIPFARAIGILFLIIGCISLFKLLLA